MCTKHFLQESIMGVIKIKKAPTYYADYRDVTGRRRRISLQTKNKLVANLKYEEIIRRRDAIKEKIHVNISWETFKDKLLNSISIEKSDNTVLRTKLAIRYFEEMKKPRFLQDVTPTLLQQFKEYLLTRGFGHSNINRILQAFKSVMHMGERWQYIPKQDWSIVKELKVPRGRIVFHTPEEIDKLLNACPSDTWRLVVLLGADAGLRRGEMINLRWEDVDFEHNQLYIAPNKTEYHRYVPMTESLRNALQRAKVGAENGFVVNFGRVRSKESLSSRYREIAKEAGVPSFLHKLRHTFASQLVQNGVELYTVSQLLGHRSIQMTEIYAHLAPASLHRAVFNLPKRGMQLVGMEEKTVCEGNKACKQIGVDFRDLMK